MVASSVIPGDLCLVGECGLHPLHLGLGLGDRRLLLRLRLADPRVALNLGRAGLTQGLEEMQEWGEC